MSTVSTRSVPPPFRQVVSGLVCCLGATGCNGSWFPRHTSPSPYCKSCTEFVNSTLADADMVAWHVVELHEVCLRDDRKHVTATATATPLSLSACRSPLAAVGSLARAEVTEGGSGCGPVEGVEVVEARAASQEEQLGQGLEHCTAERDGSFCLF